MWKIDDRNMVNRILVEVEGAFNSLSLSKWKDRQEYTGFAR